jgi:hypothetical protein
LAAAIVASVETALPDAIYELDDGHARGYAWAEIGAALSVALGRSLRMFRIPRPALTCIAGAVEVHRRLAGSLTALSFAKVPELYHQDWAAQGPRLEAQTAWKPAFDITAGFADTLAWYRAIGWLR